jgi:hypothetical protein
MHGRLPARPSARRAQAHMRQQPNGKSKKTGNSLLVNIKYDVHSVSRTFVIEANPYEFSLHKTGHFVTPRILKSTRGEPGRFYGTASRTNHPNSFVASFNPSTSKDIIIKVSQELSPSFAITHLAFWLRCSTSTSRSSIIASLCFGLATDLNLHLSWNFCNNNRTRCPTYLASLCSKSVGSGPSSL